MRSQEVFVTYCGTAFHDTTKHIFTGSSKAFTTRKKAEKKGYVPCQRCFPGEKPTVVRPRRDGSSQFKELNQ